MEEEKTFPEYNGEVESYLVQMREISRNRQELLLNTKKKECELVVENYWYTFLLSGLITLSTREHYREDKRFAPRMS
ncbi:MAG: hypothetical protein P1Q69_02880 [Candidatus Thorarchaeota archaeon]|nr:hypothetical protein [Candidatus Thorarchaeota archaeon]